MDLTDRRYIIHSPSFKVKHATTLANFVEHINKQEGYIAWSGGKDSTCLIALMLEANIQVPIVWFNSGLEYPETSEYIHSLVDKHRLDFHEYVIRPTALEILRDSGFWSHEVPLVEMSPQYEDNLHKHLIQLPSKEAHERFGIGEALGFRREESKGRNILLTVNKGSYVRKDGTTVVCPIWNWTGAEVEGYLSAQGFSLNPVYEKLKNLGAPAYAQRVGLLVDGNAAEVGRYTWLKNGWPSLWNDLVSVLPRLAEWR